MDEGVFRGFYVCFKPMKDEFLYALRPIIFWNSTTVEADPTKHFISTITLDPNDTMFPLAWAIVTSDNTQFCLWYLQLLRINPFLGPDYSLTFMSSIHQV